MAASSLTRVLGAGFEFLSINPDSRMEPPPPLFLAGRLRIAPRSAEPGARISRQPKAGTSGEEG